MDAVQTMDMVLGLVLLAVWTFLALAAANLWRKRQDEAASWLALTFGVIAVLGLVGLALGDDGAETANIWVLKALVLGIALFPYLLYRFVVSIVAKRGWTWMAAHALTAGVAAWTLTIGEFLGPDEPRTAAYNAFIALFFAQWMFLLCYVGWRLWSSGRRQPAVARKRMRAMSVGVMLVAVIVVVSTYGPHSSEPTVASVALQVLSLVAGPFFLFSFAPPGALRAYWRRRDELAMRQMEIGLVKALSREEVADALLPVVVDLLGGRGAVLIDPQGEVVGSRGVSQDEVESLRVPAALVLDRYEAVAVGSAHIIAMETGWLIVTSGPLTPFFGTDELQMLSAAAVLADLALGRAKLFELETQAREAMRDFVAIASHDLRTPVSVIHGFAQLLTQDWEEVTDEQKKGYADAIARQVMALERLISDLLTVSKVDADEVDIFPKRVDVLDEIGHVLRTMPGADCFEVSVDGIAVGMADPDHITRMIQNYVRNALVHGAPPYRIGVKGDSQWVKVYVSDGGAGVPPTFVPSLFEKFARVNKKRSRAVQGSGLGLSIVRGLARANGGDAWYEPGRDGGACFAFRVPRAPMTDVSDLVEVDAGSAPEHAKGIV